MRRLALFVAGIVVGIIMRQPSAGQQDKEPALTYLQIDKDTFLELAPATGDRAPGLNHVGIWADDLKGTVAVLRERGAKVDDPRTGGSKVAPAERNGPQWSEARAAGVCPRVVPEEGDRRLEIG